MKFSEGASEGKEELIIVRIERDKLLEIIENPEYFGKIIATFLFHHSEKGKINKFCTDVRDISLYRIFFSKMKDAHPLLFRKFVSAYRYYEEFFSKLSEGQEKNSKQLVFKFYRMRNKMYLDVIDQTRLAKLPEYESYMIVYDNTDLLARRRAILSALLHIIEKPDVFITCDFYNEEEPAISNEFILLASLFRIYDTPVLSKKAGCLGGVNPRLLKSKRTPFLEKINFIETKTHLRKNLDK
ncbi:MAG: hypothetical protein ACTSWE_14455 [Promethearchaeota archaeon]